MSSLEKEKYAFFRKLVAEGKIEEAQEFIKKEPEVAALAMVDFIAFYSSLRIAENGVLFIPQQVPVDQSVETGVEEEADMDGEGQAPAASDAE